MKVRLQRFMADCGVAARRECEQMIADGRVKVNDQVVRALPVFVDPTRDVIAVDEQVLEPATAEGEHKVYYLLNKPKGILVTNFDPADRKTVGELMTGIKERVFPVGRLDMDSRGALVLTNDGELANRLTHPRYGVEKTYIVEVDGRLTPEDAEKIKHGMWLGPEPGRGPRGRPGGGVRTERFHVKILGRERGRTILEIKISEGRNREIRRVMARIGHPVRDLNRVALAERITIRNLPVGEYRALSEKEVAWLFKASSKEFHQGQQAATQQWYEAKEMEKERKRLAHEAQDAAAGASAKPVTTDKVRAVMQGERPFRPRPVRKGKRPFVPPSGRNAGKMLGGDKLGRHAAEKQMRAESRELNARQEEIREVPSSRPAAQHPLGDKARDDD